MPLELSHVIYATKLKKRIYPKLNDDDFIMGTLLPDIIYLLNKDKEYSHIQFEEENVKDIKQLLVFKKSDDWHKNFQYLLPTNLTRDFYYGYLIHSVIDWWWDRNVWQPGLYSRAFKALGDILLFDRVKINSLINIIKKNKTKYKFSKFKTETENWYKLITKYFKDLPKLEAISKFLPLINGIQTSQLSQLSEDIKTYQQNPKIVNRLIKGLDEFVNDID